MFKKPFHWLVKSITDTAHNVSCVTSVDDSPHSSLSMSQHGRIVSNLNTGDVPLTLQVFNPGGTSISPVSSTLIIGRTEVALIDTQFKKTDAADLVKLIQSTGKKLTMVYISHWDPDHYFGCEVVQKAFPESPVYALQYTIDQIQKSKAALLAFWLPTLAAEAPQSIIIPQLLKGHSFSVDGYVVEIKHPVREKSFCWVPSINAVVGGFAVFSNNMHLWLAYHRTTESRTNWYHTLTSINNLYPDIVVPSHFYPGASFDLTNLEFTEQYLSEVERQLPLAENAAEFVSAMEERYPSLNAKLNLEVSAKVLKGEMEWPI